MSDPLSAADMSFCEGSYRRGVNNTKKELADKLAPFINCWRTHDCGLCNNPCSSNLIFEITSLLEEKT